MKQNTGNYVQIVIGLLVGMIGLVLVKLSMFPEGAMKAVVYFMVGLGCGIFGSGMGKLMQYKALKNSPEIRKQIDIDTNDERNVAIANRSKAKAFDIMTFVFGALLFSFALMGIDIITILLLVFVYLFVHGCGIYYRVKFDKEM